MQQARYDASRGGRALPGFIVAGTMKGGSSSFYAYLSEHPQVVGVPMKEIHYFDLNYEKDLDWYRSHFCHHDVLQAGKITGEATPYYMFHPLAMQRIHKDCGLIRMIFILRDPVHRAISHYFHCCRKGIEPLDIYAAMDAEAGRLAGEHERLLSEPLYKSYNYQYYSYQARGHYDRQIKEAVSLFGQEHVCVLSAEELFENPLVTMQKACDFLQIDPGFDGYNFTARNQFAYKKPEDAGLHTRLQKVFEASNERLFELIGERFAWSGCTAHSVS